MPPNLLIEDWLKQNHCPQTVLWYQLTVDVIYHLEPFWYTWVWATPHSCSDGSHSYVCAMTRTVLYHTGVHTRMLKECFQLYSELSTHFPKAFERIACVIMSLVTSEFRHYVYVYFQTV